VNIMTLDVSLSEVSEKAFRMFEDYKFSLKPRVTNKRHSLSG